VRVSRFTLIVNPRATHGGGKIPVLLPKAKRIIVEKLLESLFALGIRMESTGFLKLIKRRDTLPNSLDELGALSTQIVLHLFSRCQTS
jgi:hypothetical protein